MLSWTKKRTASGETLVRLRGELTERDSLAGLDVGASHIVIDFEALRRVNSAGLHLLLRFLERVDGAGMAVDAERCSPAVVTQLNHVPRLSHLLNVRSFVAPFECPRCGASADVLVAVHIDLIDVPHPRCDACDEPMTLAEPEDRYLAFLAEQNLRARS